MEHVALNLARKWRSRYFQEIVGQDLVVRILQNSLFKNQFFPVYLLSGQRGCGKTSTARVFAAAANCKQLANFQKNPSIQMPCLVCESCVCFQAGQHPDFIEIDAASYTGVDNIRNIIDTSSFLPILGQRKIYLIDEVHMLSKAAFNAFLKILEEPPKFVVFILATTEIQKLPETVRSRCFQLFFNPVTTLYVTQHLQHICQNENIAYEIDGLETIAHVTQGSLRDAINLLEQARFVDRSVTKNVIFSVLGYIDDQFLYQLLQLMIEKNTVALLDYFYDCSRRSFSTEYMVKRLLELLYDCIVIKYGGKPRFIMDIPEAIKAGVERLSISTLAYWFDELSKLDMNLLRTTKKQIIFESTIIRLLNHDVTYHLPSNDEKKNNLDKNVLDEQWHSFVSLVVAHIDPVLASMLYATKCTSFDPITRIVEVSTLKKFILFQDLFIEQKSVYQSYLDRIFGFQAILVVHFVNVDVKQITQAEKTLQKDDSYEKVSMQELKTIKNYSDSAKKREKIVDLSDKKNWKFTQTMLDHFGGTVKEVIEDIHEFDA